MIVRARYISFITSIILTAVWLTGCSPSAENWSMVASGRPVIGFTVEKSENSEVEPDSSQISLRVNIDSGNIRLVRGSGSKLLIKETMRIKGPASKERLGELLEKSRSKVEDFVYSINVNQKQSKEIKPLYGMSDDIEFVVPESINMLYISLKNGTISVSGMEGLRNTELSVVNGRIDVYESSSSSIKASADKGNINVEGFTGDGSYKCGRGDVIIKSVTGSVDLVSVSGRTDISDTEGKLKCDISSGRLYVRDSRLASGSDIYVSTGHIYGELTDIENTGKLSIKSADADLRLKMPENRGYSLIARSTTGRIRNKLNPSPEALKRAPSGEVYGDVAGGGISIYIYTDSGDITMD